MNSTLIIEGFKSILQLAVVMLRALFSFLLQGKSIYTYNIKQFKLWRAKL